jgi:aminobenzoyl-glutamate utilization protein B
VFSFGEQGFQEVETSRNLKEVLRRQRVRVAGRHRRRAHGLDGHLGRGKPVIALGSDIDAIPQASQKPSVAYHDPLVHILGSAWPGPRRPWSAPRSRRGWPSS